MNVAVSLIEDYDDLKNAVADLIDRTDISDSIPQFIQHCEAYINRRLRHFKMETTADLNGVPDGGAPLPEDFLEATNVKYGEDFDIRLTYQPSDVHDIEEFKYRHGNPPNDPCIYTYLGTSLVPWPIPTAAYQVRLRYYQKIPSLAEATDGVNWLLTESPDIYLYGSALHSAPYIDDDKRIALWDKLFSSALAELQRASDVARVSGSALVRKQPIRIG